MYRNQELFGTVLGNSKIIEKHGEFHLLMRSKDEMWLRSKEYSIRINGVHYKKNNFYYWKSEPNDLIRRIYSNLYHNKAKTITLNDLDLLKDTAIGVWYGDCGTLVGRSRANACLRTQAFKQADNDIIHQWFNEVGMECRKTKHRNKDVIVFTKAGTRVLFEIIAPIMPVNRFHLLF